jgi:hypothetical protein
MADEVLTRPEDHRSQLRVQPVGPDHQVKAPPVATGEDHVNPVRVVAELGDPVTEDVLDTVPGVVVEHLGQVPAQDLDVRDEPVATVVVGTEGLQHVPVRVHGVRTGGVGARRAHLRVQPHPPDDLLGDPARVHRLPAGTQLGSPLHHGHLGPPPAQPVGQRGSRDARPHHQHPGTAHPHPLLTSPDGVLLLGVVDAHHCLHLLPTALDVPAQAHRCRCVQPYRPRTRTKLIGMTEIASTLPQTP